ncbi:MAG: DUF2065 family protein [SAR86 cluster bacterium]|jgi:uncharacterized protein|tara:strand:- start:743 stop:928 length:186 start_codon:yes stop_codon:yes gene_type:complete
MWHDLGVAVCLVLVIEGVIPFLYPKRWKALVAVLATIDDRAMRLMGLGSMLIGTTLLYLIN